MLPWLAPAAPGLVLLMALASFDGQFVFAANSTVTNCCSALASSGLGSRLLYPGENSYQDSVGSYFSVFEQQITPYCILQPDSVSQVSLAIKTLVAASTNGSECQFAVRSGGHTPFAGAANIEDGITIDLRSLDSIAYLSESNTTAVQPGATWDEVYLAVQSQGHMVVGGRSSSVGVGGLVIGGGNSYYAARYGLVCDNVHTFEVVLASGEVVYASRDQNADLFLALKGGSSNLGIVTRYDLTTFTNEGIWGGIVLYPNDTAAQQFDALVKFGPNINKDPYGSVIVINAYLSASDLNAFENAYEYTKPEPRPAIFNDFLAIPGNLSDTMRVTNMSSLAEEFANPTTFRVLFLTLTFKNDIRVLTKANELFNTVVENLKASATGSYNVFALYQPIPQVITEHSEENGGNLLGLDRFKNETLILYQPYLAWTGAEQDDLFETQGKWLNDQVEAYAESIGASNPFIYLDYADKTQDPLNSYGPANVAKLRAAAAKYDPDGVFQKLMPGGFKISQVQ